MLKSAIISVSEKKQLDTLLEGMFQINPNVKVYSSGGTSKKIKNLGYKATKISNYTGFPEAPGGLVKTLHPKVHGGILLDPNRIKEKKYLEKNNIKPFNLVVCNLYPFEKTLEKQAPKEEIIENIDIGGPTLIRSAAKGALRHGGVAPVIDPDDYPRVLGEMKDNNGSLNNGTIATLVHKAFDHTWNYDEKIRNWTEQMIKGE